MAREEQRKWVLDNFDIDCGRLSKVYSITRNRLLEKNGGRALLNQYGSVARLVSSLFPEYEWHLWEFKDNPRNLWSDVFIQRQYVLYLSEKASVGIPESVSSVFVSSKILRDKVLPFYSHSLLLVMRVLFPELKFSSLSLPSNKKSRAEIGKEMMDRKADSHRDSLYFILSSLFSIPCEFSQLDSDHFRSIPSLSTFLFSYQNLTFVALTKNYPEFEWRPWDFSKLEPYFWTKSKHQRYYFDHLFHKRKMRHMSDWYKSSPFILSLNDKIANIILQSYNYSLQKTVETLYPAHIWQREKFIEHQREKKESIKFSVPQDLYSNHDEQRESIIKRNPEIPLLLYEFNAPRRKWWESKHNHRYFMYHFGCLTLYDWKEMKRENFHSEGQILLDTFYCGNVFSFVSSCFPEVLFYKWKFEKLLSKKDKEQCSLFFNVLIHHFHLHTKKSIDRISLDSIKKEMGIGLVRNYEDLLWLFNNFSCDIKIEPKNFYSQKKKSTQRNILKEIQSSYPSLTTYEDYQLVTNKGKYELDVYLPSLALAFEYQGEQHYEESKNSKIGKWRQDQDKRKRDICEKCGITLITIPFLSNISSIKKYTFSALQKTRTEIK